MPEQQTPQQPMLLPTLAEFRIVFPDVPMESIAPIVKVDITQIVAFLPDPNSPDVPGVLQHVIARQGQMLSNLLRQTIFASVDDGQPGGWTYAPQERPSHAPKPADGE